jgi:transposase
MRKKPIILSTKARAELERYCTTGVHNVRLVDRAKIILALDTSGGRTAERQERIAERLGVSRQTVNNVRCDFLAVKIVSLFLQRKQRETPPVPAKVTGEEEARIIALECGEASEGYARWTLRLLAEKCVQLHYSKNMSHMTISRLLKKHNLNLIF